MKYTTEEIKTIKGHIKAIENYCKTEIAPLINDTVCVDFSETQYRSNGSAFKKTYKFIVEKDGTPSFRSSAFTMVIDENYKREDCSSYGNAYDEWYSMQQLLTRWQKVKSKLNEEINRQKRLKSEILNFQI